MLEVERIYVEPCGCRYDVVTGVATHLCTWHERRPPRRKRAADPVGSGVGTAGERVETPAAAARVITGEGERVLAERERKVVNADRRSLSGPSPCPDCGDLGYAVTHLERVGGYLVDESERCPRCGGRG